MKKMAKPLPHEHSFALLTGKSADEVNAMSPVDRVIMVGALSKWLSLVDAYIVLNGPMRVTKNSADGFRNIPMIGEEEFTLTGARLGTTDVIIEMKRRDIADSSAYELTMSKAVEQHGMAEIIEGFLRDKNSPPWEELPLPKKEENNLLDLRRNDERFGSW